VGIRRQAKHLHRLTVRLKLFASRRSVRYRLPPDPNTVPADGLPLPQRYHAMAVILLGISMAVLDGSIVNLALPGIVRDLHADAATAVWIVTAYQVATLVLLLPCAMLGDLVGHRRVYLGGLAVFTLASLGCALAPTLTLLVVARTIQGLGAGGLMSVNGALVRLTYPARKLGRGIALNSLMVATASVAGPSLAAGVLSVASWPWLFAINLPIGIVVTVLGWKALPRNTGRRASGARLAVLDVALNVLMFGLVALGLDALGTHLAGDRSLMHPGAGALLIVAGVVVGVLYMHRQRRQATPLFPLDLLRIRVFALSMGTSVAAFAAQTLAYVALPFLLLEAYGRSPATTGLLITAWPIATVVTAPIAGRLIGRIADGALGAAGLALLAIGMALLASLPAAPSNGDIVWRMAVCGVGFGLFQSPNNHTILTSAPAQRSGAASGMLGTARLTGQTSGAVVLAIIFSAFGAQHAHGPSVALAIAAGLAAIASVFSGLRVGGGGAAGAVRENRRPA
jgi:DHA2 family multidrug resistance protein-like MFS transporter